MIIKHTPQAVPSLASWLSYLENLYSKTIDPDLERVGQAVACLSVLKPAPFVFIVAGTNGKGITYRMLESILMAIGYKTGVYSSSYPMRYTGCICVQGQGLSESAHIALFAETESARGNISLICFEYSTLSALWLFKQAQLDVAILEIELGDRLNVTNIIDTDVAVVTSIALDHTGWLGPGRESIGREKAGTLRSREPAVVGKPEMPSIIADVTQEKDALLQRRGVERNYSVTDHGWTLSDVHGMLENLPLPLIPQSNAVTAPATLRASGLEVSESVIRDGITSAILPRCFQIMSESPRVIFDVAHNPHAAECLTRCMKALPKNGRMLAIIGMLHGKGIVGILAWLKSAVDDWHCTSLEGPRDATTEQLLRHLGNDKSFDSVAQVRDAVTADAKAEDIVLVCGSFHTVAYVTEVTDVRRSGGK